MRCINCHRSLKKAKHLEWDNLQCKCGCSYSKELLETANKFTWNYIRIFRVFKLVRCSGKNKYIEIATVRGVVVYPWIKHLYDQIAPKLGWF
jgi:hypothetical protein